MSTVKESLNSTPSDSSINEESVLEESPNVSKESTEIEAEIDQDYVCLEDVVLETSKEQIVKQSKVTQCENVSLDGLSIDDKTQEPVKASKSQKINLKQHHEGRKKLTSEMENLNKIRKITPKVNCHEKIVLCIDMSAELEDMEFQLGDGRKYSGFYMAKRILEIFVHTKHRIDKQHEFALVILNETAVLLRNFTSSPRDICNVLEDLHETQICNSCDLMSLFKNIYDKVQLPENTDPSIFPPPYLVRCILIYGRSNCIPTIDQGSQILKKLQASHCYFFDALYIHRQPSNENKCQEVFQVLCDIDENYTSYIFEVSRNATKLHNYMAMLLAHPLQRPPQNEARYKLKDDEMDVVCKMPPEIVE